MNVWQTVEVPVEETRFFQIAARRFWIRRRADEWYVASDQAPHGPGVDETAVMNVPQEKPVELAWSRWGVGTDSNRLTFMPVMPDRPLVVRPEAPMRILSGTEFRFFVGIAVWLRPTVGFAKDHGLGEYPTQVLSKTWLGDPLEGELGYAVHTAACRDYREVPRQLTRVLCPVQVKNLAVGYLAFERFCVRGENLALYDADGQLWATETRLTYQGDLHGSHVETGSGAPDEAGRAKELSPARVQLGGNVLRRSFSTIRSLAEQPLWRL